MKLSRISGFWDAIANIYSGEKSQLLIRESSFQGKISVFNLRNLIPMEKGKVSAFHAMSRK